MISEQAWSASSVGPGPHRVLLALWDYAHGWRPGDEAWPVWPSPEALAAKLNVSRSTVYRGLTELERAGWIRRAQCEGGPGWLLLLAPEVEQRADRPSPDDAASAEQLGFHWADPIADRLASESANDAPSVCAPPTVAAVDNSQATAATAPPRRPKVRTATLRRPDSPPLQEQKLNSSANDDDASRIWSRYEDERVRLLGGKRRATEPPIGLRLLWRELGGNQAAWAEVERYGLRALELAAAAKAAGREIWPQLVACRADGREWTRKRYDAVCAWQGAAVDGPKASAPPPPSPIVDGVRVDRFELDAWDSGGAEAVRKQRAQALSGEQIAASAAEFLSRLRGVG